MIVTRICERETRGENGIEGWGRDERRDEKRGEKWLLGGIPEKLERNGEETSCATENPI